LHGSFVRLLKVQKPITTKGNMMKTWMTVICAGLVFTSAAGLQAAEAAKAKESRAFEQMKSLVGTWKGKTDMGQGPIDVTLQYRLLAGGSVLEERVFAGTPNEMLTMYYEKDGKLAMTHYCVMGNRPGMLLKSADAKTIKFDFDETCGINPAKESHMHALTITFDDPNTITTSCKAFMDGKEMEEHPTTMKRVQAS
jgi:hypothetical protein